MPGDLASDSAVARGILRDVGAAALATLGADGAPFASYVITALAPDGSPLLFLSGLAVHTANLGRDDRASLLFVQESPQGTTPATARRLTLAGRVSKDDDPSSRERFLARHPDAALYAGLADFSMFRFTVASAHLVAGFGRIARLSAEELAPQWLAR